MSIELTINGIEKYEEGLTAEEIRAGRLHMAKYVERLIEKIKQNNRRTENESVSK
ncbi:MAG: hypothetical protein LBU89_00775 [Fibromonadaceae bacterium]|jgi:hypothetical protein|nr:hypothetical protein [Fibromonadaceae bacterium]